MNFTESLLLGLILAGVSALTLVAYRHPRGYRNIAPPLLGIGLVWALGRAAWDFGAVNTNIELLGERLQTPNTSVEVLKSQASYLANNFRDLKWTVSITAIVTAYLAFLFFLPKILVILPKSKGGEAK